MGDVVADSAVAARRCQCQATGVIGQRHRHAVDLQFEHPGDRPRVTGRGEEGLDLPRPGDEIVGGVGVVDRQHRDRVPHRGEAVERLPANALRRAVGCDELWVPRLESAELVDQPVVVEIADLGCRLEVVASVVVADQVAERRDPLRAAELKGRRVVLVDDVMTSGASLLMAASVLRLAGATHVSAVVLTRTAPT